MLVPSIAEARELLAHAGVHHPGPWVEHSRTTAEAARAIATRHPALDPDRAYVLGLLHDIGRGRAEPGSVDARHILDGYQWMLERGYEQCARICLTHSFPIKQADAFASPWDSLADKRFVQDYLDHVKYTAYDRLIQLCDAVSLPHGPCVMEKRLVDVALRHGFNSLTLAKWQAFLALESEFGQAVGTSIYTLLPGAIENTFDFTPVSERPLRDVGEETLPSTGGHRLAVLVTGQPASGKTTLARHLARELALPLISRDPITESLADTLLRTSRELSDPSFTVFWRLVNDQVEAGSGVVAETNLHVGVSEPSVLALSEKTRVAIVHCVTARGESVRRFAERCERGGRHWCYQEDERLQRLRAGENDPAWDRAQPLELDLPCIRVDTTDGYVPDLHAILRRLRSSVQSQP